MALYDGEQWVDVGGPLRVWIALILKELFSPGADHFIIRHDRNISFEIEDESVITF
jgi:hypothetical protein